MDDASAYCCHVDLPLWVARHRPHDGAALEQRVGQPLRLQGLAAVYTGVAVFVYGAGAPPWTVPEFAPPEPTAN
jgi:hypothetical protein